MRKLLAALFLIFSLNTWAQQQVAPKALSSPRTGRADQAGIPQSVQREGRGRSCGTVR